MFVLGGAYPGLCAPAPTTTTLTVASGGAPVTTVTQGTVVTLTAAVTSGATMITWGQVNFCDATAALCTDIHLLGTAQLIRTGLPNAGTAVLRLRPGTGVHQIKAVYAGRPGLAGYGASQSAVSTLSVTGVTTASITQSGLGENFTLTATVAANASRTAPTGTVSFVDTTNGNKVLGSAPLGSGTVTRAFVRQPALLAALNPTSIAVGDFNGDGIVDLAVTIDFQSNCVKVNVLLSNGDGTFQAPKSTCAGGVPSSVATGDFNHDGNLDLAVTTSDDVVIVLPGRGNGTFAGWPYELGMRMASYATGRRPTSVAVGDFNGDSIPDLAVANGDDNTVSVLLGKGGGAFRDQVIVPVGRYPDSIVVGDFDGNGKMDLAVSNRDDNTVSVLLSKYNGTVTTFTTLSAVIPGDLAAVGDFNRDGKLDLAVTNAANDTVTVLLGKGNGTFQAPVSFATGTGPSFVAVGDFNSDGIVDLAVANSGNNTVSVLTGRGNGAFNPQITYAVTAPGFMTAPDFNGDGLPDLAIAGSDVTVLLNKLSAKATASAGISLTTPTTISVDSSYPGDSVYAGSTSAATFLSTATIATGLALSANPLSSSVYSQQVMLTASLSPYIAQGFSTDGEKVTFYDGGSMLGTAVLSSGEAKLAISSLAAGVHSLRAMYANDGVFLSSTSPALSFRVVRASTATTLALTVGGSPVTAVNVGTVVTLTAAVTGPMPVTLGQMNFCDATVWLCTDIHLLGTAQVTSSGTAVLKLTMGPGEHKIKAVYIGSEDGLKSASAVSTLTVNGVATTTTIAQSGSAGNYTLSATVAGTGSRIAPGGSVSFVDTTASNTILGTGTLAAATVTQTFAPPFVRPVGPRWPFLLAMADLNGDGKLDLVMGLDRNCSGLWPGCSAAVCSLLGNGDGTFSSGNFCDLHTPDSIATGDFNGDGKPDLAFTSGGALKVLLGNGNGSFGDGSFWGGFQIGLGNGSAVVGVGDFNGDGKLDLAIENRFDQTAGVVLGNGDGTFQALMSSDTQGISSVVVGDFNGDGKLDLAFNHDWGTLNVLLGNGDGTFRAPIDTGIHGIRPAAVGDFNGDGKLDLAGRNDSLTVGVVLGNGDGTFRSQVNYAAASVDVFSVAIGDFNRDGKPDLAVGDFLSGEVSVLLGKGDGTFIARVGYATGYGALGNSGPIAIGDFDGDGAPDLAVVNPGDQTLRVALNHLTATAKASVTGVSVTPAGSTHSVEAKYAGDSLYAESVSATTPISGAVVGTPAAAHPSRRRAGRARMH